MNRMFQVVIAALVLSVSGVARASEASARTQDWRRTMVSVELTSVRAGLLSPVLEYALTERLSLTAQLQIGWTKWTADGSAAPGARALSLGGELGLSAFLMGRAPDGLWLSARFGGRGQRLQSESGPSTSEWTESGALLVGYTRVFTSGLSVQVGVGPSLEHTRSTADAPVPAMTSWSAGLRALAAVGFAF